MIRDFKFLMLVIVLGLLTSCYSVRLRNVNGAPELDPFSDRDDYYRGMAVTELDTVITVKALNKDFTYLIKEGAEKCESGKLNIIEYRNTFGGVLLSGITFGKKRKVKIKYVCEKKSN